MLIRAAMKFGPQWAVLAYLGKKICDLSKMPDVVRGADGNLVSQSVETEKSWTSVSVRSETERESETVRAENSEPPEIDRAELEELIAFYSFKESTNAASQVDEGVEISTRDMKELTEMENELKTMTESAATGRDDEKTTKRVESMRTGLEILDQENRSEIYDPVSRFVDDSFWSIAEPEEPVSHFVDDPFRNVAEQIESRIVEKCEENATEIAITDDLQLKIESTEPQIVTMVNLVNDGAGTSRQNGSSPERTHRQELPVSDDLWDLYRRKQQVRRPKHTKNPFFAFKNAVYCQVRSEMPELEDRHEIMQEIVRRWHELPQQARDDYKRAVSSGRRRSAVGVRSESVEAAKKRLTAIVQQERKTTDSESEFVIFCDRTIS